MVLEKEYEIYKKNKEKLLVENIGKFVLIKDMRIVDIYVSYEDALKSGLKEFGNIPFLIKKIEREEEVNFFYHGVVV